MTLGLWIFDLWTFGLWTFGLWTFGLWNFGLGLLVGLLIFGLLVFELLVFGLLAIGLFLQTYHRLELDGTQWTNPDKIFKVIPHIQITIQIQGLEDRIGDICLVFPIGISITIILAKSINFLFFPRFIFTVSFFICSHSGRGRGQAITGDSVYIDDF